MRIRLNHIIFVFLLFTTEQLSAQREANTWYFGRYLGLDFNSGSAIPLNDGALNTTEGVATISNKNGNLLFYTDGIKIWNRLHQVMPNGTGLFGNVSSTQSAVIVPKIGDTTRYYVFTVDAVSGPRGLTYSIVNITLDGGKGDVEQKNLPLQLNVVEKITAVKHCNNRDIWVIAHGSASDIYYSFLVTAAGVSTSPVISHTGSVLPGVVAPSSVDSSSLGYLKASTNGKKIAAAHWTVGTEVSDFDNATGIISNSFSLFLPSEGYHLPYGVEFSPNSNLVYTSVFYTDPLNAIKRNALLQYDISLGAVAAIRASKQIISQTSDPIQVYAALQVAPDNKMYMAKNIYKHIACINDPDVYGPGCNFTSNAIQYTLPNQESSFGLPTFIQSYFYPLDSFTYTTGCDLNVSFNYTPSPNVISVQWNFDDPVTGINNTSLLTNPTHLFSAAGTYNIQLIKFTNCGPDTIRKQLNTNGIYVNLGADTLVCGATSILLNGATSGGANTYLWQDGSTNPTLLAAVSGLYWVQVTNALGCNKRDSITITFKPYPVFNLGPDRTLCTGDTLTLNATVSGATGYLWNTGVTTPSIRVAAQGTYWCEVNNGGCIFRDSLTITNLVQAPVVNLGNDQTVCGSIPIVLDATNVNSTYTWQNGSTNATLVASTTGLYWVEVKNLAGCINRDSINITFKPAPIFNLGSDTPICFNDTLTLNATAPGAIGYQWSTGAISSTIKVYQAGTYWCEVDNGGCLFRDSLIITAVNPLPVVNLGADITVCEGVPVVLDATYLNSSYTWQNGSTNAVFNVTQPGSYFVQVSLNGCKKSDTIVVNHTLKPRFTLGPDQLICPGNQIILSPVLNAAWQYNWQDGSTAPTFTILQPGSFSLSATNSCGTTTDQVKISDGLCKVFVPTGFTPNNDGKNDYFKAFGTETVTEFDLKVFDRAGQVIFQTKDKNKGWDGKLNGTPFSSAVFIYMIKYKEINTPEPVLLKGAITLIR